MPQMGESITEGTITKWLKKVGDTVQRDEPIFEISTDKVDAEIPSPVAGTLTEIKVKEGSTVTINTVVAVIGGGALRQAAAALRPAAAGRPAAAARLRLPLRVGLLRSGERPRSSPLVRKIAKDNNVDLSQVPGTGSAGRITKTDILGHLEKPAPRPATCSG
jgi:pyruvate dehydrogenase E2 component (dihydrolipoamide acetyltransferase)